MIRTEQQIKDELQRIKEILEKSKSSDVLTNKDKYDLEVILTNKISVFEWILMKRVSS